MEPIHILKDLVRIPSVSRKPSEITEFIASRVDGSIQEFPIRGHPNGRNVIAISEPCPGEPFILLNGHHDTVAPVEGWNTDPFDPLVMEGNLHGLGTNDMKAGLAVIMALYHHLRDRHNIIFTSSDDEESDSMGSFALVDPVNGPLAPYLPRIAGVLVAEPTGERVMLGARGRYALKLTVHGLACHGARPHLGINAVDRAADIAVALRDMPLDTHPKLGRGSYSILGMRGGTETLSVPDHCDIVIDRHITRQMSGEEVIREFRQHLGGIDVPLDISLVEREVPFLEPYACSPEDPFIKCFLSSLSESITLGGSSSPPSSSSPLPSPTSPSPSSSLSSSHTSSSFSSFSPSSPPSSPSPSPPPSSSSSPPPPSPSSSPSSSSSFSPSPPTPPSPNITPSRVFTSTTPTKLSTPTPSSPIQEIIYGASVGDYNIFGNLLPTIVYGPSGQYHHSANEYVELDSVRSVYEKLTAWLSIRS